jgi:hypothetical protein
MKIFPVLFLVFLSCTDRSVSSSAVPTIDEDHQLTGAINYPIDSWQYFLQHLPVLKGPVLDYTGKEISNQIKHSAVIDYDIGTTDLQQCADALIRLRAEYLFGQKRFSEIRFHFTSGHLYSWEDYCEGKRPVINGNQVYFINKAKSSKTHQSLRKYLDIVYTYAGTISLNKELKPETSFDIGTVVITPGSPGHCFIIIDKALNKDGENLYKLAEGYTPAQSIYVLSNLSDRQISPWYKLDKGAIHTSSYTFNSYYLKKFE